MNYWLETMTLIFFLVLVLLIVLLIGPCEQQYNHGTISAPGVPLVEMPAEKER